MTIEHVSMVEHVLESQHVMRLNQHVATERKKKYVPWKIRQTTIVNAKSVSLVIGVRRLTLAIQ